ncbi:FAD-dependent oxidoreductase [Proteiniphilum sp.]|uniref:FAD-dependent oxidoreductase n=1 Tax=Proteiniphilum sp. TaxID=1926877 RepID=UPI002B212A32|nr:FAD-dependent oxidoreductase [Proteiniphilum sp.]MEA4918655.1 FAD-dependent oxidoreductase [Proteiniphilum sp.]
MVTRRDFIKLTTLGGTLAATGQMSNAHKIFASATKPDSGYIMEGEKKIPIIEDVDIVIVGGTSAAVAAAGAASRTGSKVFLVAPLSYLGDDICGSFKIVCNENEKPDNPLSRRLFLQTKNPTPLYIKTELENELIDYDVDFLYSSYVTNILVDQANNPSGIVIANRSGRQAIRCKAIIDATHVASVARIAGAQFTDFKAREYTFNFVTVGSEIQSIPDVKAEKISYSITVNNKQLPVVRYSFQMHVENDSYAIVQDIEQIIRDKVWTPEQSDSSDILEYVPFVSILSEKGVSKEVSSVAEIPIEALKPKGIKNLWILGPSADIPNETANRIMRPVHGTSLGIIVGETVALSLKNNLLNSELKVYNPAIKGDSKGEIKELLRPLRQELHQGFVTSPNDVLPILDSYDVIVMGGGTAGGPAGISAARQGVKTLVLEYLHGLGGIMTLGLIGRYWDGYREGFSSEVDHGVRAMAPLDHPRQLKNWKNDHLSDWKQEFFRRELRKAGGDLWFGILGCGALVKNNKVSGIVVTTPYGRGVILSKIVIDSTGSADVAIAAGADYNYTGENVAVQGAGMGSWKPGDFYNNNDWAFIDDSDVLDISRIYVQAKKKLTGNYDMVKLPQTRERRRMVGECTVSVYDVISKRRYPDTISYHMSSFDTHGMIVDPYFILSPPEARHTIYDADVPLRALLPKGMDGIIVTGLGASADRDAMPVIRMQSCLQNQGFSVGYLAATAIKEEKSLREINIKKIQKHLVEIGNLPDRILKEKPFKGYSDNEFSTAAKSIKENYKGLEVLLSDHDKCRRTIKKEIELTSLQNDLIIYASVLCMLGDNSYAHVIADEIKKNEKWDVGWNYTGMGQFGPSMSRMDSLLFALGKSKDKASLPVILEKAALLKPENTFSHFRAVASALGEIKSKDAVPVLYNLLMHPGMRYHHLSSYRDARRKVIPSTNDTTVRNSALKEIHLAHALFACGDKDNLGETILKSYANGLEGHYAQFSHKMLIKSI